MRRIVRPAPGRGAELGRRWARRAGDLVWLVTGGWAALSVAYLLALLASAATRTTDPGLSNPGPLPKLVVIVPAHNEESGVASTVRALLAADYPVERREVIVVADNCSDATAAVAASAGATVWARDEPAQPGKGEALAWAFNRAAREIAELDGVIVVDADCLASGNLLQAIARRLVRGDDAVQVDYVAGNPEDSGLAALRYMAFLLMNTVRPRGKDRLGLSAGLLGTGMAFSRAALARVPWEAFSVTEDREYHLRLLRAGIRVAYAREARVVTPVPATVARGNAQQTRWDTGNALMTRRWLTPLVVEGARRRDVHRLHAAVELAVPPQVTVIALTGAGAAVAAVRRSRLLRSVSALTLAGEILYVVGGVSLVGSPRTMGRALPAIPGLVATRLAQQAKILRGRGAQTWERTERSR